jgi:UDP-hydrolysing UDP-N-acetyl-D-glucosamine 2-epimerase
LDTENEACGRRRVCIVVHSRANYGRVKSVMRELKSDPRVELQLVVGASALLNRTGNVVNVIEKDGFEITACAPFIVEGNTPVTMAKSTGLGIIELATLFENIRPEIVVTVADRFETMATAISASYMNIPVAHIQGGEVTGSIDESVRHAVTRLSHLHFPATERAAQYLVRMGEDPERVFWVGCPSIDTIATIDLSMPGDFFLRNMGTGNPPRPNEPYVVVLQHPVTTEYGDGLAQMSETLEAVRELGMRAVCLWPNIDAGADDISKGLRLLREWKLDQHFSFFKNFPVEDYARLIANCSCLIGNSSSALREGAFMGVPAVNIGSRQQWREHADNVINVPHNAEAILAAARRQIAHGRYPQSTLFGDGTAGRRIAKALAVAPLDVVKVLNFVFDEAERTGSKAVSGGTMERIEPRLESVLSDARARFD